MGCVDRWGGGAGRGSGEECLRSKIVPFSCNTEGVKHARVQGGITAPAAEPSEPKKPPKPEKERVGEREPGSVPIPAR